MRELLTDPRTAR